MSILSKLTLTNFKRPTSKSPLDEQAKLAEHEAKGTKYSVTKNAWTRDEAGNKTRITRDKLIQPWYFADGQGVSLTIRCGARVLDLGKGRKAVSVPAVAAVPEVIATVINAVRAGEPDAAMDAAVQAGEVK